ncbi:MAG: PD-(D/E)XK nuclease family protein [Burkholderiales bacterium]|nr:PD-(D/E)XK nuclease family protein [Burkholderiales bacterium]
MPTTETIQLPTDTDVPALWAEAAARAAAWLQARDLAAREAIVLLPFAALLGPARAAFAAASGFGGWPPRIETPLTLAAALGPPPQALPGHVSGDVLVDRLAAGARVRRLLGAAEPAMSLGDLEHLATLLVDAAHRVRDAALARPPAQRPAFLAVVGARTAGGSAAGSAGGAAGPAQLEARLLGAAVSWCAEGVSAATDRLFAHRPTAWIAVEIGGFDALIDGVLAQEGSDDVTAARSAHDPVPVLRLVADAPPDSPFAGVARPALATRWLCDDAEDEARAAALAVIEALDAGRTPVALVALDRSLVRRVRALLERADVPLIDETGWQLSTTRAAARLMALLRAAQAPPGSDAWLDWLTTWPSADAAALRSLEAAWRGRRRVPDRAAGARLEHAAAQHLVPLAQPGRRGLHDWLQGLAACLRADDSAAQLAADDAGTQVLAALRLDDDGMSWGAEADAPTLDLAAFAAWVAAALEVRSYTPLPGAGAAVVITPLARATLRPFAHAVVPAADHRHLGQAAPAASLVGEALAAEFGLGTRAEARQRQRFALAQLMRVPAITLLRRRLDEGEVVADSPDLQWLLLEAARRGAPPWPLDAAPTPRRELAATPLAPPHPVAAGALPAALSATQVEALRDCPYRFFARAVLRLDEPAELEADVAKRDYGEWLHLVLQHFHAARAAPGAAVLDDATRLQQAAAQATTEQGLDEAGLLPFRASFEAFAPAYLRWVVQREATGWHWQAGEVDAHAAPAALAPTVLRGRLDRVDAGPEGTRQVIDYKTGDAAKLRRKVAEPLEDTQLAFYAALLGDATPLQACYLALDGRDAPREIAHADVQRSAAALVAGLADEMRRVRDGATLDALGEGEVCEHCEARGLCRRDHWCTPAVDPEAA